MTSRRYVWTIHFDYLALDGEIEATWDQRAQLAVKAVETVGGRYTVFQLEKAPETGRYHFQGYTELKKPQRPTALIKALKGIGKAPHVEVALGTPTQCRDYCTKVETRVFGPWENGEFSKGQGHRTDCDKVLEFARQGRPFLEVADALGGAAWRFLGNYEKALRLLSAPVDRPQPEVIVLYGDSGTGKTHDAKEICEGGDYFIKEAGHWWDGYTAEKNVILDEFQGGFMQRSHFLRLLDKGRHYVEVKGAMIPMHATRFIITSNFHPRSWYDSEKFPDFTPFLRRITRIIHYQRVGDTVVKTAEPVSYTAPVFSPVSPLSLAPVSHATFQAASHPFPSPAPCSADETAAAFADIEVPEEPPAW